jgi:serine/threonine-protein kinase HipA
MTTLLLDVRIDGFTDPVGQLLRAETGALSFAYTATHTRAPDAVPVSLSLPLSETPDPDQPARTFLTTSCRNTMRQLPELWHAKI